MLLCYNLCHESQLNVDKCVYSKNDYALCADLNIQLLSNKSFKGINIREPYFEVTASTCSLCFKGEEMKLFKIDAYTNYDKWIESKLSVPESYVSGQCFVDVDNDEDRYNRGDKIEFIYDKSNSFLEVCLGEDKNGIWVRASKNVYLKISNNIPLKILITSLSIID